jgi:hypothetical protein
MDATTAHEFNHSIQFGLGALTGANAADDALVEGGATWMEDEVYDNSDDNLPGIWGTTRTPRTRTGSPIEASPNDTGRERPAAGSR